MPGPTQTDPNSSSLLRRPAISTESMLSLARSLRENQLVRPFQPITTYHADFTVLSVRQVENYPTAPGDAPTAPIVIAKCGILQPDDPSLAEEATAVDGDPYEDYPDDEDRDVQNPQIAFQLAKDIREIGNRLFKEGKTDLALAKYQSISYHNEELYVFLLLFQNLYAILTSIRFFRRTRLWS